MVEQDEEFWKSLQLKLQAVSVVHKLTNQIPFSVAKQLTQTDQKVKSRKILTFAILPHVPQTEKQ